MKKIALCLLLSLTIGLCVTISYGGKPSMPLPDLIGTYEGYYTRFDLTNKEVRDPQPLTMYISGQDGRHFWGSINVPNIWPSCNYFNGVILDDNKMYFTQWTEELGSNHTITIAQYTTGVKQIQYVIVRPYTNETSYASFTYSSSDTTESECPY